jgi:pyridoxal phosphate enzyme (YggS family)
MMSSVQTSEELGLRLRQVRSRIEAAAARSDRNAGAVKLVAVSKTHAAELVRQAIAAGVIEFGENRVQEAESKIAEVGRDRARWHLIGHLQSNKARRAVQLFDVIHSLDSVALARRLERACEEEDRQELPVLVQVDLGQEATKSGVTEQELPPIVEAIKRSRHLKLTGLMTLPPFFEDTEKVRPFFGRLRELRNELRSRGEFSDDGGDLSMGMTHDFEVAIEEGATIVRVGTAIFGEREHK